ncbi:MAG: beta-lactamase family protein [Clostridia bacterium]|nr:beta-lactamase family protein [Clostridia bacterium]
MLFRNPDAVQAYLDSLVEEGLTPCISAAIAYKGEVAAAFTACRKDDPMYNHFSADTRLNIGSVTKIITGALMAKLMESGRISVNDNVKKHLPEYPFDDNTVLQLLCHSTGTDSFCCNVPRPVWSDPKEKFVHDILATMKRTYAPGTQSCYFTYGYSLLMEIIERVSGMDYMEFANKNLLSPLGMTSSTFDTHDISPDNMIMPYNRDTGTYENSWTMRPTADSGLFTTAGDLLKFAGALQDAYHGRENPVFTPWQAHYLFRECTENKFHRTAAMWRKGEVDHYNFFSDFNSPEACGHTGYSGCMLCIDPTYEISVVILTNSCYLHHDWNNYRIISDRLLGALGI